MAHHRYSVEDVIAEFRASGAEPTFTSYTGASQRLSFLCSCPEQRPGETTFRAIHYQGVAPRCPECKASARQGRMRANRRSGISPANAGIRLRSTRVEILVENYGQLFARHGVKPLSDYKDARTPIFFVCPGEECSGARHSIMAAALRDGRVPLCPLCREKSRPKGESHYRWDFDRTPEQRAGDRSAADKAWEAAVLRACAFICVITGRIGRAPHHMYGYAGFPEFRLLMQNGVCLTRRLHDEFTARHPNGLNTYDDFAAFYEEKTGRSCPIPDPMLLPVSERIFIA